MGLGNWPYWIRGGFYGIIIFLVILVVSIIFSIVASCDQIIAVGADETCINYFSFTAVLPVLLLFMIFNLIGNSINSFPISLSISVSLFGYLFLGITFGAFYGRLKRKKEQKFGAPQQMIGRQLEFNQQPVGGMQQYA